MNKISTSTLGRIAIGIALGGAGALYVMRWCLQNKIRNSVTYQEAMECFRSNTNARELLGEPIVDKAVDVGDNNCYGRKDNVMWVKVPLKGRKHNANLNYWVSLINPDEKKFEISKIELEIGAGPKTQKILLNNSLLESKAEQL